MSDDKMRDEFEKWATPYGLDLRRLNEGYLSNASNNCWIVWQAAYAAGQKAEREAIFIEWENGELLASEVERLRAELAETKRWLDERSYAYGKTCSMVYQLQAELAAAKAASVVQVKWKSVERFFKPFLSGVGNKWGIEFWFDTKEQRDKFGKWMKERGEG